MRLLVSSGAPAATMVSNSVPSVRPTTVNQTQLVVVVVPDTVTAVAAGAEHSLALGADGTVWTCGVVLKSMDKDPVQVSGVKSIIAIAAGGGFNLALRADGTVWSWGVNDKGQLGDGTNKPREKPVPVKGLNEHRGDRARVSPMSSRSMLAAMSGRGVSTPPASSEMGPSSRGQRLDSSIISIASSPSPRAGRIAWR